ncbi:ASCH domain-containing protein [Nonomuraea sp. LPB2021202275-12-8]|uniref:ASCH domain-containing protein n=1 Tax=Nonomuraea sp. LPB2021202275-12-8 TaxID=3120159 RepID=UPI00300D6B9E
MWGRANGLRVVELGTPGEMRTWLTDLVLAGSKKATAGLLELDYQAEDEELEHVGEHLALIYDSGSHVATLEVVEVALVPFAEVSWEFAQSEGEGYGAIEDWREAHRRYWQGEGYEVDDATTVVCLSFRLATS